MILFITAIILTGCSNIHSKKEITARLTFYNGRDVYKGKRDPWGNKVAASSKLRAKEGVTCAAHPDFPFFTKISIPALKNVIGNGIYEIWDRGSAVTKKIASKGKYYVFDIYVNRSSRELKKLDKKIPDYDKVIIYN